MICILHGYLLEGSGSNLWTRSIIHSLCRNGETVHLLCQENHPEIYDFISTAYYYREDGVIETRLHRDVPYPGRCIMHKPFIGNTLPVYVWDRYDEFSDVQPMIHLNDTKIENYLEYNLRVLKRITEEFKIRVLHVNHAVLMSVVAHRISNEFSIPFAIMPHGSALEYAVKKDQRFFKLALDAFAAAERIFVIGKEIRQRVNSIFSEIKDIDTKMVDLNLGVDTDLFKPLSREKRINSIEALCAVLNKTPRGKNIEMSSQLKNNLFQKTDKSKLMNLISKTSKYIAKRPDVDIEARLKSIDWQNDRTILFVGRLIAAKGIHLILAALPFIFKKYPQANLIIVGHGPLREPLEAFLFALENNLQPLAENIINWGTELEGSDKKPFKEIQYYFKKLEMEGIKYEYFDAAKKYIRKDRVIFTGYLRHQELRYLFPACDVAVFPSIVAEAGPLVFLEAMASGCFPVGTYFSGIAASIDSVSGAIPPGVAELMKLRADKKETVSDIVNKVQGALAVEESFKLALRQIAVEKYDWQNISKRLAGNLYDLKQNFSR